MVCGAAVKMRNGLGYYNGVFVNSLVLVSVFSEDQWRTVFAGIERHWRQCFEARAREMSRSFRWVAASHAEIPLAA